MKMEPDWFCVTEKLPMINSLCWVCDQDRNVFQAWYVYILRSQPELGTQFICPFLTLEHDILHYPIENIKYWMPFKKPIPPGQ